MTTAEFIEEIKKLSVLELNDQIGRASCRERV